MLCCTGRPASAASEYMSLLCAARVHFFFFFHALAHRRKNMRRLSTGGAMKRRAIQDPKKQNKIFSHHTPLSSLFAVGFKLLTVSPLPWNPAVGDVETETHRGPLLLVGDALRAKCSCAVQPRSGGERTRYVCMYVLPTDRRELRTYIQNIVACTDCTHTRMQGLKNEVRACAAQARLPEKPSTRGHKI